MFPVKQRHDRDYPVRPRVWPFLAWAVVGAGLCIALLTALTIGIFVLPVTLGGMAALLLWRGSRNGSAFGLPAGAGTVPLYVSYLNRGGPGNVCATAGTGQSCISADFRSGKSTPHWPGWSGSLRTGHGRQPAISPESGSEERRVGKECRSRW